MAIMIDEGARGSSAHGAPQIGGKKGLRARIFAIKATKRATHTKLSRLR